MENIWCILVGKISCVAHSLKVYNHHDDIEVVDEVTVISCRHQEASEMYISGHCTFSLYFVWVPSLCATHIQDGLLSLAKLF